MFNNRTVSILLFFGLLLFNAPAFARTWTDSTGKHTIEADFVSLENGVVTLKKDDGSTIQLPLDKLSGPDQEHVKTLGKVGENENPFVPNTVSAAGQPPTKQEPGKPKPPSAEECRKAEESIISLLKDELAGRNKGLPNKLLQLGKDTKDDPASKYVLLKKAVEIGASMGDAETVWAAMDELESSFSVNSMLLLIDDVDVLSRRAEVGGRIQAAIDKAYERDDYDSAVKLAGILLSSAKNAKDVSAIKSAAAKVVETKSIQEEFKKTAAARQKMKTSPTDPEANRILGSFLCFIKKDWDKGVPMLIVGDDAILAKIAKSDLEGKNAVEIGDTWNLVKGGKERSLYWYRKALPDLSGIQKARVEKLVRELEPKGAWDDFDISQAKVMNGFIRLDTLKRIQSKQSVIDSFRVTVVARTENNNIRMKGPGGSGVIFNWEVNPKELVVFHTDGDSNRDGSPSKVQVEPLRPNQWYKLEWKVTETGMLVSVNGAVVFSESRPTKVPNGIVTIFNYDSIVDLQSVAIHGK